MRQVPEEFHHIPQSHWTFLALLEIADELHRIRVILDKAFSPKLDSLEITIMPKSIAVGAVATAHIVATGTDGKPFMLTAADTITPAASVPSDVTFGPPVFNADGSADIPVTGVNADAGDSITATVDGVESSADVLTIEPAAVKVASVTLTLQ